MSCALRALRAGTLSGPKCFHSVPSHRTTTTRTGEISVLVKRTASIYQYRQASNSSGRINETDGETAPLLPRHENIYTIPNAITASRILACPFLGWSVLSGEFAVATGILVYAGVSDWIDGYVARRYNMGSVLGTILDPAADKALMATLTVTLSMKGLLPIPLACIIIGRDVFLSVAAFFVRYRTLPAPKTMKRFWDFSIPSAEVHPTRISKLNTALQLLLMGVTTINPLLSTGLDILLEGLQWSVACTTVWSGISYAFSTTTVRRVRSRTTCNK